MICPSCSSESDPSEETCFSCGKSLYAIVKGGILSERYEVLSTLGRGGMGVVYKAHDRELDETVAIKVLRPDVAQSADVTKRFRNEIRLARRIRHKNVCAIHEYGQHAHLRFIVMEYVPGVDFKQILREKGPLTAGETCRVAIQVADGLQAIHEAGIVHRDLKTPNIMRDAKGAVRLMDFGVAKQFEGEGVTGVTMTGLIVGTPEYMSPEQAKAEKVDARTDLYSLGIVIHELLTGAVPFSGDTPLATLMKHLTETPALEGNAAIPSPLVPVLKKALAKDRDERFSSADAFAGALRNVRDALDEESATTPVVPAVRLALDDEVPAPEPDAMMPTLTPVPAPVPTLTTTPTPTASGVSSPSTVVPSQSVRSTVAQPISVARAHLEGTVGPPRRRGHPSVPLGATVVGLVGVGVLIGGGILLSLRERTSEAPAVVPASLTEAPTAAPLPPSTASYATPPPTASQPTPPLRPTLALPTLLGPPSDAELKYSDPAHASTRLSWSTVGGAASYHLVIAPTGDFARALVDRTKLEDNTIQLRGLPAGSYFWRVAVVDGDGHNGPFSEVFRFTIARRVTEVRASLPTASPAGAVPNPAPALTPTSPPVSASPMEAPHEMSATASTGLLRLAIRPYAEVEVDGRVVGTTPLKPLTLPVGVHMLVLSNPGFRPLRKKVMVEPGKTTILEVDLAFEAFPK